ncbi:LysR family transcriptional regulator [Turicimonas muris]
MKPSSSIEVWKLFHRLQQLGSINKLAEEISRDPGEISRKMSRLEQELKIPLLDRHARPFRLTKAGIEIAPLVEEMLNRHAEILECVDQMSGTGSPLIRIMVPNTFTSVSHSLFFEYAKFFPNLKIRITTPVDTEKFRNGQVDIAAVTGEVRLPEAILIPRGKMIFVPVASPTFLQKYGPVDHPKQLSAIPVGYLFGGDKFSNTPFDSLLKKGEFFPLKLRRQIEWTSSNLLFESVIAGDCISLGMPLFYCINALKERKLVPILNGWHRASQLNYLACHSSRWNVPYIRTFMNWFAEQFAIKEAIYEKEFQELFGIELLHELMSN